jgi:exosortase A-associated hydrolase 1
MRRLISFTCAGETLVGTIDEAEAAAGVLIVSGGNELRIGAHRGMAELAARLAAAGVPVLRYDRRGIGDSAGENRGFQGSAEDIAAAASALRREAEVARVIGFGNCDAATALALFGAAAGLDALVLSNPWLNDQPDALPPPAAIRARYAERLRDFRALLRLVSGKVSFTKLINGLRKASARTSEDPLAARMAAGLERFQGPVTLLLAARDNTAVAFQAAWRTPIFASARARVPLHEHDSASHSYQHPTDKDWLLARLLEAAHSAA